MNPVDVIAAAYIAFGAWRGRMRGLADEGYRLVRLLIAFVAGCGLYGVVSGALKQAFSLAGGVSAPLAFVLTVGIAWWFTRWIKKTITTLIAARFMKHEKLGGLIAGGLRVLIIVISVAGLFHLADKAPGRDSVSEESIIGRIADRVIPGK